MADLDAYRDNRQPWQITQTCPACELFGNLSLTYTEETLMRDARGRLTVNITVLGHPDPHHIVSCGNCGFEYEMGVPGVDLPR